MSGTLPTLQTGVLLPFCAGFFHAVFVHQKNGVRPFHLKHGHFVPKKMGVAISPGGASFVYSAGIDHTVFVHLLNGISFHSPTRCFALSILPVNSSIVPKRLV